MFSLQGKSAVITGGGSGIGKAIAMAYAAQGAIVHILDINMQEARIVADEINQQGGKAYVYTCDVSDQKNVLSVFSQIGPVQILVNNAGIAHVGNAEGTPEDDFDRIIRVNVKGVYNCVFAAIPQLRKSGGGCIINMASIAAQAGIPDRFAYSASKGAVMAMTLSIAKDYLGENIRCNSISPARVHTPFVDGFLKRSYPGREEEMFEKLSKSQPIGRMAQPDEIASLAVYLASDEAAFITGADYLIDGGFVKLNN